jgi:hypothetical protein
VEGPILQEPLLNSSLDALVVAVPFVAILAFGIFRLDQIVTAPRNPARTVHRFGGNDERGEPLVCDPDGTHPSRD